MCLNTVWVTATTTKESLSQFQTHAQGGKKVVQTDEWRNDYVEERLEYALVKVNLYAYFHIKASWDQMMMPINFNSVCFLTHIISKHLKSLKIQQTLKIT